MTKKIILFSGDPNSINSEIIYKTWRKLDNTIRKKIYLISNYNLIQNQFKKLKYSIKIVKVSNINELPQTDKLKILNVDLNFKNSFNIPFKANSKFVKKCLNYAHKLSSDKQVVGFINCPINKKLLGNKNIGLTEYLAQKCKIKKNSEVMLITNEKFSVSPITTHIKLKNVSKKINKNIILEKIKTLNNGFKKIFNKKPRICLLGLNPHNSELTQDSEEKRIIIPSIIKLKNEGIKIFGPFAADTAFINEYKNYDVVVGMYHDQVITPFKTIYKFNAINITLGLKYLRASPDHGIASSLIGKKKADPLSLIKCIKFINKFSS